MFTGIVINNALPSSSAWSTNNKPISTLVLKNFLPENNKTGYYECIATADLAGRTVKKTHGINYNSATRKCIGLTKWKPC